MSIASTVGVINVSASLDPDCTLAFFCDSKIWMDYDPALNSAAEFASVKVVYEPIALPPFFTNDGYVVPSLQVSPAYIAHSALSELSKR